MPPKLNEMEYEMPEQIHGGFAGPNSARQYQSHPAGLQQQMSANSFGAQPFQQAHPNMPQPHQSGFNPITGMPNSHAY